MAEVKIYSSMLCGFCWRAKALLDKRDRFRRWAERMGEEELFAKHPSARGYLRPAEGYRLYDRREALIDALRAGFY